MESIVGVRPSVQGRVVFNNVELCNLETLKRLQLGIAYIPEDRLHDGFLPTANIA